MDLKIINLNSETTTKQELIDAIANNQKVYHSMIKEIQTAEQQNNINVETQTNTKQFNNLQEKTTSPKTTNFYNEMNKYTTLVKKLKPEDLKELLVEFLSSKDSSNYEKILLKIKLELYREVMNINQLFDETTTKEDLLNVLIDDQFIMPDEEIDEFIKDVTLNKSS